MTNVFDYSDYRELLKDFYEEKKRTSGSFSFRAMSAAAGVKSSAFYKLVMEGKRSLTKATVMRTAEMMKLDPEETAYFENLVFFNQSTSVEDKNHFFEKMVQTQKKKRITTISSSQMNYFSEWYHPIVRELVVLPDFKGDFHQLGRWLRPNITAKQAEGSVNTLVSLGFLKRDGARFVQTEPSLNAGSTLGDFLIVQYQIQLLKLAIESFDRFKDSEKYSSTTTIGLSRSKLKNYYQLVRDFRNQLQQMAENEKDPDIVYSLSLNLFPVTNPVRN